MAKAKRYTTPKGIAKFPRLDKPETEVNGTEVKPRFKCTVILDKAEAEAFRPDMEAALKEAVAECKKKNPKSKLDIQPVPIRAHVIKDEEGNEETVEGKVEITAKTAAEFKDTKTGAVQKRRVPIFDAKGIPLKNAPKVGGGSTLQMAFTIGTYTRPGKGCTEVGVTLYLEAVRILDLVEYGSGDAKSFGFDTEDSEGGFSAEGYAGDDSDLASEDEPAGSEEDKGAAADY